MFTTSVELKNVKYGASLVHSYHIERQKNFPKYAINIIRVFSNLTLSRVVMQFIYGKY